MTLACKCIIITNTYFLVECDIIKSISSPSASSLLVRWTSYTGATNYILDLRVVNMSSVAPVVVTVSASTTQKQVFGLSPGTLYNVVVKVFRFYSVECLDTGIGKTGQWRVCVYLLGMVRRYQIIIFSDGQNGGTDTQNSSRTLYLHNLHEQRNTAFFLKQKKMKNKNSKLYVIS